MRHEEMFVDAALHADPADENRFMLHETWQSHEDVLTVQLARPYRAAWHEAQPELLAGERKISMWQKLRDDRACADDIQRKQNVQEEWHTRSR
ncbi:antibiotic biosynthesis monooxygenase [Rhizobium sp. CG4]|uniref:putative quinol monooxygenase n=1 Tax=Rhizobium sp. CG4 TaxID=2726075 RepID=UPI00332DFD06